MELWHALVLGLIEALTEYLPVSSTGHLILGSHLMGLKGDPFTEYFEIVIQGASILAVIVYYRKLLWGHISGLVSKKEGAFEFFLQLLVAFIPAAVIGLMFHKHIKAFLFGPVPVVSALLVGGILMIFLERRLAKTNAPIDDTINYKKAFFIGCAQVFALWPGTSRSMCTLLGGRFVGLSPIKAAEFSFLLAIPVILAATGWDLLQAKDLLAADPEKLKLLGWASLVSFVASIFVIRVFLGFLKRHSLEVFGWYRIVLAVVYYLFFVR